jgi:penicillin-binding protein 1B
LIIATLLSCAWAVTGILVYDSYSSFAQIIDQQIAGGYLKGRAGFYAAPRVIETGARLSQEQLVASLQRAGYARNVASSIWSGSFEVKENQIRIMPRNGSGPHQWVDVTFAQNATVASLRADDSASLRSYSLEPELLTSDAGLKTGQQQTVTYPEIPDRIVQAILAIEDRRFFQHKGVDIRGVSRAFMNWATSGFVDYQQGGSTITQQLVKNTYLTPEKTLRRKFNEALIALALERRLSKQDIFALYCNEVYLGQRNGVGVRGIAQAARVYFGKELKDLSLAEAATIAGMIQSPARYAPDRHPDAARERRDQVIAAMTRDGSVDAETAQQESASAVKLAAFESANEFAPYYLDSVNRAMENEPVSANADTEQTLRVQTTIDPDLQMAAETALRRQLDQLSKSRQGKSQPQGALVALDVHTGNVLAMVGGRNYAESQLNRATDARRQPGSVFKPFVYATAFESGISPLTLFRDAPQTFMYGNATYAPDNFGQSYAMRDVLLRDGLVRSLNVVTVELALRTGLARVANTAAQFGLPKPDAYPSMALGTFEATPLQIAAAYAAFANGGAMVKPKFVVGTVDNLEDQRPAEWIDERKVIRPSTAYMITDALSDVIKRGTAQKAKASFSNVAIAGKTGTSRDGWFVGYTPNLVCVVWIGFDDNEQLGMTGAEAALPAWIDFMKDALAIRPSLGGASFKKPGDIVTVRIDPETGALAGPDCPSSISVNVAYRLAPPIECYKHMRMPEEVDENSSDLDGGLATDALESPMPDWGPLDDKTSETITATPDDSDRRGTQTKPKRQATQTEISDTGQPRLVTAPTLGTPDQPR